MILLDHEEVLIDARFLLENEVIKPGLSLEMPVHKVIVDSEITESKTPKVFSEKPNPSSLVNSPTSLSLNFDKGVSFKKDILDKFGSSVAFQPGFRKREFFLVISFGRTSFKLDIHTVGLVLQACFGDPALKFRVSCLRERDFRFLVDSRAVGFQIYNAGKVVDPIFEFHISLWGNGGPNWIIEERKFYREEEESWKIVISPKNQKRISAFQRLVFPEGKNVIDPQSKRNNFALPRKDLTKSFVEAVKGDNADINVNIQSARPIQRKEQSMEKSLGFNSIPQIKAPKLPGLYPFLKFKSFNAPDPSAWPANYFLSWFKAHGPKRPVITGTCLKDLRSLFFPVSSNSSPVSSTLVSTVNPSSAFLPSSSPGEEVYVMANIPIDPRPFVPRGF
jgi:hypothetical protein